MGARMGVERAQECAREHQRASAFALIVVDLACKQESADCYLGAAEILIDALGVECQAIIAALGKDPGEFDVSHVLAYLLRKARPGRGI
jgi:hypothetical protein